MFDSPWKSGLEEADVDVGRGSQADFRILRSAMGTDVQLGV